MVSTLSISPLVWWNYAVVFLDRCTWDLQVFACDRVFVILGVQSLSLTHTGRQTDPHPTHTHHTHAHLHLHLPCSLADLWGTTGDFTANFLHSSRFSASHSMMFHSRPVYSLLLSSHHFLCLPLRLSPCTVPSRTVLGSPDDRVTCPYHFGLRLFTEVRSSARWCLQFRFPPSHIHTRAHNHTPIHARNCVCVSVCVRVYGQMVFTILASAFTHTHTRT